MISSEQIIQILIKSEALTESSGIKPDSLFADHGIDSLDIFSLLLDVQEQTGVEISDDDVDGFTSINAILDYINKSTA